MHMSVCLTAFLFCYELLKTVLYLEEFACVVCILHLMQGMCAALFTASSCQQKDLMCYCMNCCTSRFIIKTEKLKYTHRTHVLSFANSKHLQLSVWLYLVTTRIL